MFVKSVQLPITLRRSNRTVVLGKLLRFGSVTDRTTNRLTVKDPRRKPRYQVLHFAALPRLHFRTYPSLRGQLPSATCLILSPFLVFVELWNELTSTAFGREDKRCRYQERAFGHPQVTQLVSDRLRRSTFLSKAQNLPGNTTIPRCSHERTRGMRLGRTAIGRSLCNEVSLSNQLTPFDAGNPAPTPDRPANER
ncbi:hypothetical protein F4679DRAFT_589245 [Xylaria curta]|nr:hypothetical protein F4679DRAFT_589245 [Xylaria curta]